MLKHNISWKDLKIGTQECSNDEFGLICNFCFFYGKAKYALGRVLKLLPAVNPACSSANISFGLACSRRLSL